MAANIEQFKFFRDHNTTVLNLATGSLVLSATFLHDNAGHLHQIWLVQRCWWLLGTSVLFGVAYNYLLNISLTHQEEPFYKVLLATFSLLTHAGFVSGIFYLLRFGLWNI